MARLSLCLIARDEERMLPGCLASVKGLVDEVVVLDTGSVDATARLAREAGAKVVPFTWCDDFSAARNTALAAATGDWILVLDADERLGPGARAGLRAAMRDPRVDCFLLPLHNASRLDATHAEVLSGSARRGEAAHLPRLLRRSPDLAWEGVVHESVAAWLTRGARRTGRADVPIVHYGAVPELRSALAKDARNLRLLERRCELEPENPVPRAYLVRELLRCGSTPRADREIERAWSDLLTALDAGERPASVPLASIRAHRQLERGEPDGALATLAALADRGVRHPNLDLLAGMAWSTKAAAEGAGWDAAEAAFRRALAADGGSWADEVLPGATSWQAAARLAQVLLATGRHDEAVVVLAPLPARPGEDLDPGLLLAEARLPRDPGGVLTTLEPVLPRASGADTWLLAAQACEALGAWNERNAFLARASSLPVPEPRLIAKLRAARAVGTAAELFGQVPPLPPGHADVAALCAAASDAAEVGDAGTALGSWLAALRIDPRAVPAWLGLGAALHGLGRPDLARSLTAGARAVSPDHPELLLLSAELALEAGDRGEAARLARRLQALAPEDATAAALIDELGVHGAGGPTRPGPAPSADGTPLVSVVVPTHGRPDHLLNLLDRLALQDLDPRVFEVIVVDDGSPVPATDGGPRPYRLTLLRQVHAGPAAARNLGVTSARGSTLVFYDDDALPEPDGLRRHLEAQLASPSPEAVRGRGGFAPEHLEDPFTALLAAGDLLGDQGAMTPGELHDWAHFVPSNLSVPRAAVVAAGGFDPGFATPLLDGAELGYRLQRDLGLRVRHRPEIRADHDRRHTFDGWLQRAEALGRERFRLRERHGPAMLPALRDGSPEARLAIRSSVEAELDGVEQLRLSVVRALARDAGRSGADRQRLVDAVAKLGRHHQARGLLAAAEGWPKALPPRRPRPRDRTSVILPNLNGFPHVKGCLGTLRAHTVAPLEVIVVDNGSTDGSLEWLKARGDVRVLEMGSNLGAPAARNRGLAVASGERVLFCDNDVLFTPRWHEILTGHLEAWPDIGMVGPVSDYVVDIQKAARPPAEGESLDAYAEAVHRENRGQHAYTAQLILFFILARRELVERIGGIDEGFGRWGFEDNDWSLRARLAGYQLRIARDCFIRHLGSRTSVSAKIDYNRLLLENWGVFKRKWDIDPELPYGARVDLGAIVARGFDPTRHYVPFR